jgi:hypothetical protein
MVDVLGGHQSLYLIPFDFYFWGYIKGKVYVPPLPQSLKELQDRICDAVMSINKNMLCRIWNEVAFRWDMHCITHGSHIEHL